ATIDEAYVNKVLAALDAVDGEATRLIVQNRNLVPEATARLRAIYDESEFREQVDVWLRQLQEGLRNFKPDPGPQRTTVRRVVSASATCVFSEVQQEFSAAAIEPSAPNRAFVQLVPLDRSRDQRRLNTTAWMIRQEGDTADGSDPGDLCAG
ncbi:MAG: hypothetical protein M3N68_12525, partial [Actinomycetota bacterium]|nr:hypothetical protein [Actinomycetota bacterium]